jgi:hypothetical protein
MKQKNDLVASLTAIKLVSGRTSGIELDFVLTNQGKSPLYIAERWNSWGAYQWGFQIVDAKKEVFYLDNPVTDWTKNFLTTVAILPKQQHRLHSYLAVMSTSNEPRRMAEFYDIKRSSAAHEPRKVGALNWWVSVPILIYPTWQYPIQITGMFGVSQSFTPQERSGRVRNKPSKLRTWTGKIQTDTLLISQNGTVKRL